MKIKYYALIAAVIPFAAAASAWAQNSYYPSQTQQAPTLYNSGQTAQPLALQRMLSATTTATPGVNAPSYTYNNQQQQQQAQPYNFGPSASTNSYSAQQGSYYDQNALPPSERFMQEMARQQAAAGQRRQDQSAYYAAGQQPGQNRSGSPTPQLAGIEPPAKPQRRVVYKDRNNPLQEPQRLFNPDQ